MINKTKHPDDTTSLLEVLSCTFLFCIAFFWLDFDSRVGFHLNLHFWNFIIFVVAGLQIISVKSKSIVFRATMAFISGIIWTWLAFSMLNMVVQIFSVVYGLSNMYAFIILSNQLHFDWDRFLSE